MFLRLDPPTFCHTDIVRTRAHRQAPHSASHPPDGPRPGADDVDPHRQGRHRARRLGCRRSAATGAARRRAMSTLLTARLPPTARPSRRFPGPLIWSSRSQTTAGTRRSVERGDRKKSCAEFLRTTHSLYLSDFRGVTPAINLTSTEMRRAPGRPRPVFIDRFGHRGWPVASVRAQRAQLGWWTFGSRSAG